MSYYITAIRLLLSIFPSFFTSLFLGILSIYIIISVLKIFKLVLDAIPFL